MTEDDIRRIVREEMARHHAVGGPLDDLIDSKVNGLIDRLTTSQRMQTLVMALLPDLPTSLVPGVAAYLADKIHAAVPPL